MLGIKLNESERDRKIREVTERLDKIDVREYYSIEWPIASRKWTFGIWVNHVLEKENL